MRALATLLGFITFAIVVPLHNAGAGDLARLVPMLKQGGYVLVMRHVTTDDGQKTFTRSRSTT